LFSVSVILACHNVEEYIDDAFQSLVRQSAFSSFEVIPVDDGSTDGTAEIIEQYRRRFPDSVFPITFPTASGAAGRPRNAGIEAARGRYLIFMDPDDRVHEDGYSTLLRAMEEHRSDIVIAARVGVPPREGIESKLWTDFVLPRPFVNDGSYAVKADLLTRRPGVLKSIYRAGLVKDNGLRFREDIASSEDEIFDMSCVVRAEKLTKINDIVYLATMGRGDSLTSHIRMNLYEQLPLVFQGLDDALLTYFGQPIVSYRIVSLIRNFYLPKLVLIEPGEADRAIEIIREACAAYGYDRLRLAENPSYGQLVELLEAGDHTPLILHVMQMRNNELAHQVHNLRDRLRVFQGRAGRGAVRAAELARMTHRAVRGRELRKYFTANVGTGLLSTRPNGYWVFGDRHNKAADNGEALYRYVRDAGVHDRIAFVLDRSSPDWKRLHDDGFELVGYGSLAHWRLLYGAAHFFTSHVDDMYIKPWQQYGRAVDTGPYKLDFLQHGIIRSDLSGWLGTRTYNTFCSSAPSEYNALLHHLRYRLSPDTLKLTGLARHDLLERREDDYILVLPTWRSFLDDASPRRFAASEFHAAWQRLLTDERLLSALDVAGKRIRFGLHPRMSRFMKTFTLGDGVDVLAYEDIPSFADLICGAQMLVTDYSSVSFDALYLRRPVVYYPFPERHQHQANIGQRFDVYPSLGVSVSDHDSAVEAIVTSVGRRFKVDDDRLQRIDAFFAFKDQGNRKRIIDAVLAKDGRI
jgi:glycosyltransferase involved in cell wall biosynthesis